MPNPLDDEIDDEDREWLNAPLTEEERQRAEDAIYHDPWVYDMDTCERKPNPHYIGPKEGAK